MNLERAFEKAIDSTYYIYNKIPYKWLLFILFFAYSAYTEGIESMIDSLILALTVFIVMIGIIALFFILVNLLIKAGEQDK